MFPVHPAADLFPLMSDDELDELAEDIQRNGLRESLVLNAEGILLDGRNRDIACGRAGIAPHTRTFDGFDPVAFIISMNLKRRHLSASQRAMIAAKIANLTEGRPQKTPSNEGVSQTKAAELMNVGVASVERAAVVSREGAEKVIAMVQQGEVSVSAAAAAVKAAPKSEQERWNASDLKKASRRRQKPSKPKKVEPASDSPVPETNERENEAATERDSADVSAGPTLSSECQGDLSTTPPDDAVLRGRFAAFSRLVARVCEQDVPLPAALQKYPLQYRADLCETITRDIQRAIAILSDYLQSLKDLAVSAPK